MKYIRLQKIFFAAALSVIVSGSCAEELAVCAQLRKEKTYVPYSTENRPVMYLIDDKGNVSNGPIRLTYTYEPTLENPKITTNYRLVVYPKRIKFEGGVSGNWATALLESAKDVCPNSNAYKITYQKINNFRGFEFEDKYIQTLPQKEISSFQSDVFIDSKLEGDGVVNPICRFDCKNTFSVNVLPKKQ